eukprot:jgi/Bigna1/129940/aug1.10_g4648
MKEAMRRLMKERTTRTIVREIRTWISVYEGKSLSVVPPDELMDLIATGDVHVSDFVQTKAEEKKADNGHNALLKWFVTHYTWCVKVVGGHSEHVNEHGDLDPVDPRVINVVNFADEM